MAIPTPRAADTDEKDAANRQEVRKAIAARSWKEAKDLLIAMDPDDDGFRRAHAIDLAYLLFDNHEMPRSFAFPMIEELLENVLSLQSSSDRSVLRIAGSLYKRRWHRYAHWNDLRMALHFYKLGYVNPPDPAEAVATISADERMWAYNGINAAFVLDATAFHEAGHVAGHHQPESETDEASDWLGKSADALRYQANEIRREVIDIIGARAKALLRQQAAAHSDAHGRRELQEIFGLLGEAHFGLLDFDAAASWFAESSRLADWDQTDRQLEARCQQIVHLAEFTPEAASTAGKARALEGFLGGELTDDVARSLLGGKWGLALSGGGFRAALFHVGVLALLARRRLLRDIQVLSCVSGGSITGSLYYLALRRLLESKADHQITDDDYMGVVADVSAALLNHIGCNLRTRVLTNPWRTLEMAWRSDRSPSTRLGDLLEEHMFAAVPDGSGSSRKKHEQIHLNDLQIQPEGDPSEGSFKPRHHNWRRRNKVPILIINSTSLNTGHSWQFTTAWMGEREESADLEIDPTMRLKRIEFKSGERPVRLGQAVAASAAVPGAFEPVTMGQLYAGWTVRLVDGGVHDNQGVAGLLEEECDVLVVSDASGQLRAAEQPPRDLLNVPFRSNYIMMQRVRGAQYIDLRTRVEAQQIRSYAFLHLTEGLTGSAISPIGATTAERSPDDDSTTTALGIQRDLQEALANIRTDLDTFSEVEAFSLMTAGYLSAETQTKSLAGLSPEVDGAEAELPLPWPHHEVEEVMSSERRDETGPEHHVLEHLKAGRRRMFRWFALPHSRSVDWALLVLKALLLALFLAGVVVAVRAWRTTFLVIGALVAIPAVTSMIFFVLGTFLAAARKERQAEDANSDVEVSRALRITFGRTMRGVMGAIGLVILLLIMAWSFAGWPSAAPPGWLLGAVAAVLLLHWVSGHLVQRSRGATERPANTVWKVLFLFGPGGIGFVLAWIHLLTTNRWLMEAGKWSRVPRRSAETQ